MTTSVRDITSEIKAIIIRGIDDGRIMATPWIIAHVLMKHPVLYHPEEIGTKKCDSDFAELARRHFTADQVRRTLRLFKKPESEIPLLPGYQHLQRGYLTITERDVDEDGDDNEERESIICPIEKMSNEQLRQKAAEYRSFGAGCYEHADEIDRYIVERDRAAVA
jgi:hypothetical protein